jgi:hypothetical protein
MAEFFKWLSENPMATNILIIAFALLIIAFVLAVVITVIAFIRKESISIGGLRFGPEPVSRWVMQSGEENIPADYSKKRDFVEVPSRGGRRTILVRVHFDTPFKRQPKVVVSLQKIDIGDFERPMINRLLVRPEKVRLDGFDLCFETWEDSKVYDAAASWIAFGE